MPINNIDIRMAVPVIGGILLIGGMLILAFVLFRRVDRRNAHRSFIQLLIYSLYWIARWQFAIAKGLDAGYIRYRRVVRETALEIENEQELGLIFPATETTREKVSADSGSGFAIPSTDAAQGRI